MRKCLRCGSEMLEGIKIETEVNTVSAAGTAESGMGLGFGSGGFSLFRRYNTGGKTLFGNPKYRVERLGTPLAALCKTCGEVSLYIPQKTEETKG